jgi:AcrR family transcriptional regulator
MTRWQPDARGRLAQAAIELYAEHGFEQTTVAEIAARAGLTERTFFRHFADKRDVLFGGSRELEELMVDAVVMAPESAAPLDAVRAGLEAAGALLAERRPFARQRQRIIAASPELREREVMKLASLAAALTDALRERGVEEPTASLAAEVGVAVFRIAFERWVAARRQWELPAAISETLDQLAAVAAPKRRRRVAAARR